MIPRIIYFFNKEKDVRAWEMMKTQSAEVSALKQWQCRDISLPRNNFSHAAHIYASGVCIFSY